MDLQYIADSNGKHTALVITIEERNIFTKKKPLDFLGCITKETAKKMIDDIESSREQCERNI